MSAQPRSRELTAFPPLDADVEGCPGSTELLGGHVDHIPEVCVDRNDDPHREAQARIDHNTRRDPIAWRFWLALFAVIAFVVLWSTETIPHEPYEALMEAMRPGLISIRTFFVSLDG